jgi:hypothetical protein
MQQPVEPYLTPPLPALPTVAPTAAPDHRARVAAIALAASALALAIAYLTKAWFSAGPGAHVGLLGIEACKRHGCESMSWFAVKHGVAAQIPVFATFALVAGAIALGFILHTIAMLVRGTPRAVQLQWLTRTLSFAAAASTAFVVSLSIGETSRGLSIDWGVFVGIGSVLAAGIITATLVRPLTREHA